MAEGSANEVLQGYREMGQNAGKGQIYSEGSGDDRATFWQLTLNNDIKLNLGRGDTMKRLARFVELYPVLQQQAQTDGKRISYVDLRYLTGQQWKQRPCRQRIYSTTKSGTGRTTMIKARRTENW